jgi:cytidylate kinase
LLGIDDREAKKTLKQMDKEQHNFFKKAYGKTEAPAYEFDLVINSDHIKEPAAAAEIVAQAFRGKFPD